MSMYGRMEVWFHRSEHWHEIEVSGQLPSPDRFILWPRPPYTVGLEAEWAPEPVRTLWRRENILVRRESTPAVQPVAHRCTDWAIPAPYEMDY
jgi:hypothetical protein